MLSSYLLLRSFYISKVKFLQDKNQWASLEAEHQNLKLRSSEYQEEISRIKEELQSKTRHFIDSDNEKTILQSELNFVVQQLSEQQDKSNELEKVIQQKNEEYLQLKVRSSELVSFNDQLQEKLDLQKQEIEDFNKKYQAQFEQLAQKILDEKTEKFTLANHHQLNTILQPFKENLEELKKTVHDTYDKEAKERFSLGEKVKELQLLNQQISEDAKNLAKALKGNSKTQGNWGEMILESILEKSGLAKDREYFMEYQLHDAENNPLRSDSEGKKMRPDAVVKYPDNRNVIIDSKVSLTAFTRMVDAEDTESYNRYLQEHLTSVRQHINTLSKKGYDDFNLSLDFVMMFIPSEPAYIAAMQGDPNLWQYAYDKRILLLSPTNLITSLKLILDLWKREYQNQNALEIAERGAKLYDKFVGFVDNMEKVGKNIEQAQDAYQQSFKQLYSGRDNLVAQAQKLVDLGVKNKKHLATHLVDSSQNNL
ncbi:DNA recombination protein RmuC [Elizabethkingia sp. JS20170427COW]|nr:DNA recombination protein RmuC [Elizabethkingia sp. JS20170427COW]QCX54456.1 DNA recombination protein RmuC [Elizabethkingia sp. JS20170427COW]